MRFMYSLSAGLILLCAACTQSSEPSNSLTEKEKAEGWTLLFDGKTLDGWQGYNKELNGWVVEDGALMCGGLGSENGGGDIMTVKEYDNFELSLEWKISPGGNSGIIYLIHEDTAYSETYATGPEYQVIDDIGWPEELNAVNSTGANYDMDAPAGKVLKPVGEWNTARIIKDGDHVEHWLNGKKVVEYTLWNDVWKEEVANSKWKDYPGYGQYKKGHISLQDHDHPVWYRDIKLKVL